MGDNDFNSAGGAEFDKEMAVFATEEKEALSTPLDRQEVQKMESNSKTLLEEITSGLNSYGQDKFWRKKPFFKKHLGI